MVFDHDSQHVKHLHTYSCTISCCKLVVVFLESSSDDLPLPLQPAFPHHSVPGLVGSVGNCCEASQSWKTLFWKERVVIHSFWLSCFWKEKRKAKGFRAINPLLEKKKLRTRRPSPFPILSPNHPGRLHGIKHVTGIWPVAPSGQERNQEKKRRKQGARKSAVLPQQILGMLACWTYLTPPTSNIQQLGSPILSLSQKHAFHSARASSSSVSLPGTSRRERTLNSLATWYLLNPGWDPWDMVAPRIASSLGSLPCCPIHDPRRSPGRPCIKKTSRNWVKAPSGSGLSSFRCIKLCFCLYSLQLLLETAPKVGEKSQVAGNQRIMLFFLKFNLLPRWLAVVCWKHTLKIWTCLRRSLHVIHFFL